MLPGWTFKRTQPKASGAAPLGEPALRGGQQRSARRRRGAEAGLELEPRQL